MAVTIRIKRSSVGGVEPSSLQSGELAINTVGGALFYGNTSRATELLMAPTFVGSAVSNVSDPKNGQIRYDPASQNMQIYVGTENAWKLVGFPQAGGVVNGQFTVAYDGRTYISTSIDLNGGSGVIRPGTLVGPHVNIPETCHAGEIVCSDRITVNGQANFNANMNVEGSISVDVLRNRQEGGYTFWKDSTMTSGRMHIGFHSSGGPSADEGDIGDIWYGI